MVFIVNKHLCSSCIFGPHSPIPAARFEDLKQQWAEQDCVQQCHQSTQVGGTVGCRGHYEAARRGDIPHPMAGVFGDIPIRQTMQIAESLQLVQFVNLSTASGDLEDLPFDGPVDDPAWDELIEARR